MSDETRHECHERLLIAGICALALCMCAAVLSAQAAYDVRTGLQFDEGYGLRISNGSDTGNGVGAAGSLTDGAKAWTTNQWAGGWVTVSSVLYPVLSNTATVLTVTGTPPAGPTAYALVGGWRGWNILGATDLPYDFVDEYPADTEDNAVERLVLDTQDRGKFYPRINGGCGDSGRIIRMQIKDGGVPMDLTGMTLKVTSKDQDDNAARRTADVLTPAISDASQGWIEWILNASQEMTEPVYFYISLTKTGEQFDFPTKGYLYIDCEDKAASVTGYTTSNVTPQIIIRASGWQSKSVKFRFLDSLGDPIDLADPSMGVAMNYDFIGRVPSWLNATSCTHAGVCTFDIAAGMFTAANIYALWFRFTSPSGEIIYAPARGHIILEVQ